LKGTSRETQYRKKLKRGDAKKGKRAKKENLKEHIGRRVMMPIVSKIRNVPFSNRKKPDDCHGIATTWSGQSSERGPKRV